MLKVSQVMQIDVYMPRRGGGDKEPSTLTERELAVVGKVRQVVFTPKGDRVVGFLIRRPDVAGMIKREDAFLALDSFAVCDAGLVCTRGDESMDDAARERLGLDWDQCVIWCGMDAKTREGRELGWVSDVEFSPKTGLVKSFFVDDGSVAKSLVGSVVIPRDLLVGYKDGYLVVADEAAHLALNGGLAARAGEGYAKAKQSGKEVAARMGSVASDAVEKGAHGLGRVIGKAKKGAKSLKGKDGSDVTGRTRNMFGSFMDEYRKASK